MNNELIVTINGKVSKKHKLKQATRRISRAVSRLLAEQVDNVRTWLDRMAVEAELERADKRFGTNMLNEYKQKQKQASISFIRQQYGL